MTPFQALYGTPPPTVSMYLPGSTAVHAVDVTLRNRDALLRTLRSHMTMAQNRMKQHSDQSRTEREFAIGDWVYLKLHPYRQQSLIKRPSHKLSPRFYGPFQISARIGTVAYRLKLPPTSKIHPVFHVSLLKKRVGAANHISPTLPQFDSQGEIIWVPAQVLDVASVREKKHLITKWLIQWTGLPVEDATWENAQTIVSRFPTFAACGQASS